LASFRLLASGAWQSRLFGSGPAGAARVLASFRIFAFLAWYGRLVASEGAGPAGVLAPFRAGACEAASGAETGRSGEGRWGTRNDERGTMSSRREGRRKCGPGKGLRRSGAVLGLFGRIAVSSSLSSVRCWLSGLRFQVLLGGWGRLRLEARRPRRVGRQESWQATRAESAQRSAFRVEEHEQRSAARKLEVRRQESEDSVDVV